MGWSIAIPVVNINNPYETEWYNSVLLGLTHCHIQPTNVSLMVMVPCKKKNQSLPERDRDSLCHGPSTPGTHLASHCAADVVPPQPLRTLDFDLMVLEML